MRVRSPSRSAFTLVELLVVIAIIVLLMSLILPAIQKVRESANKMLCASNMRQIGMAAHNYHAEYKKLPPGYLGRTGLGQSPYQAVGVLTFLLPYVEQDKVFKELVNVNTNVKPFDFHLNTTTNYWWTNGVDYNLARTRIKLFICPSDQPYSNTSATAIYIDFSPGGTTNSVPTAVDTTLGRSNYCGVNGLAGYDLTNASAFAFPSYPPSLPLMEPVNKFVGMFANRSDVTLGQVTAQDGTSNTFMFGEYLAANDPPPQAQPLERLYAGSWMGVGAGGTLFGMPDVPQPYYLCFSSRHKAGVQFCFGDCSVRTIRRGTTDQISASTDWEMLQELAGRKDGTSRDRSAILE